MVCHCHNSFLLFCQLSVFSERIVPSFRDNVTYHFYALEGLMEAYNIHLLQSMHCYSTCSELYAWLLYQVVFLCINGYFHVFPSVLSVLSISLGNKHTSSVKVVLFSHNSSPHRISRVNCKKIYINSRFFISRHSILLMTTISIMLPYT